SVRDPTSRLLPIGLTEEGDAGVVWKHPDGDRMGVGRLVEDLCAERSYMTPTNGVSERMLQTAVGVREHVEEVLPSGVAPPLPEHPFGRGVEVRDDEPVVERHESLVD